jgi:tetratricopeptide (TPR) repeat protein
VGAAAPVGGRRQFADEPARAEACYLKAAALDPGFAPAWVELGRMAEMRDDRPGARDFFRKAADADPSNDYNRYLFVNALKAIDRAAFVAAVDDLIVRFPDSQWSARALLTVAQIAPTLEVRAAVLERHLARFPSQAASSGSARDLYDVYLAIGPDRALALARRTAAQAKGESLAQAWTARTALAERVVAARDLLSNGKATEAGRLLQAVAVPPGVDPTPMVLLRAEAAERAGDAPAAYARLIDAAAEWPAARVETALVRLGERRGRSAAEVDRDVWAARERTAKVLEPFELDRLDAPTRVRLADHAGQVVLVNFWFPT